MQALPEKTVEILRFIAERRTATAKELYAAFPDSDLSARLFDLRCRGCIRWEYRNGQLASASIRADGDDYLTALAQKDHKRAEAEAKKYRKEDLKDERWRKDARRSWVQWTVTTVLTVVSFFSGALVEKLTGFIEWITKLWQ